jgi:hypothetical protein
MEKKSRALRGLKRLKLGDGQNKNGMDLVILLLVLASG